jgi:hypothetical protein
MALIERICTVAKDLLWQQTPPLKQEPIVQGTYITYKKTQYIQREGKTGKANNDFVIMTSRTTPRLEQKPEPNIHLPFPMSV